MTRRYRINLPNKEECRAKGIKFEDNETRVRLWLIGVAQGVSFAAQAAEELVEYQIRFTFNVFFPARTYFYVDCDNELIMANLLSGLGFPYGCTVEEHKEASV